VEGLSQQDLDAEVQKALAAVCGGGLEIQTFFPPIMNVLTLAYRNPMATCIHLIYNN